MAIEDHNVVEVEFSFPVDFDESEVAVLEGLDEGVAGVETCLTYRLLTAHCNYMVLVCNITGSHRT